MTAMVRSCVSIVIAGLLVVATACKSGPSEDQCKQLLDHYVDMQFKKAGAAASGDALKAELDKKQQVSTAVSGEFIKMCRDKMARTRVECGLAANDEAANAKCDESK